MVRPEYDIVDVHAVAVSMAMAPQRIFGPLHGRDDGGVAGTKESVGPSRELL
jgi:hypothetical protein